VSRQLLLRRLKRLLLVLYLLHPCSRRQRLLHRQGVSAFGALDRCSGRDSTFPIRGVVAPALV